MTDRPHSAPKKSLSQRIGVVIGTGILLALPVWLAILLAIHFDDVWAFVVSLWEESKHISYEECIERGGHVVRGECVLP